MNIYNNLQNMPINKFHNSKDKIRVSKELFDKANGLNRDISKVIIILRDEILSLDKSTFEKQNLKFQNSFVNHNGIYITKDTSEHFVNNTINKIHIEEEQEEEKYLQKQPTAQEKGYKAANSSKAELQKLYQKLREYENKLSVLEVKIKKADGPQASIIKDKIIELTQKISAIKEQIQMILAAS